MRRTLLPEGVWYHPGFQRLLPGFLGTALGSGRPARPGAHLSRAVQRQERPARRSEGRALPLLECWLTHGSSPPWFPALHQPPTQGTGAPLYHDHIYCLACHHYAFIPPPCLPAPPIHYCPRWSSVPVWLMIGSQHPNTLPHPTTVLGPATHIPVGLAVPPLDEPHCLARSFEHVHSCLPRCPAFGLAAPAACLPPLTIICSVGFWLPRLPAPAVLPICSLWPNAPRHH